MPGVQGWAAQARQQTKHHGMVARAKVIAVVVVVVVIAWACMCASRCVTLASQSQVSQFA